MTGAAGRGDRRLRVAVAAALLLSTVALFENVFDDPASTPERYRGSTSYSKIAVSWAEGGPLSNSRPPLFPLWLGVQVRLFGVPGYVYSAVALQTALIWAVVGWSYLLAARGAGSERYGAAAALLLLANVGMLREFVAKRETVLYAFVVLALFALLDRPRPTPAAAAAAGLLCAVGWLTRPSGVLLAPAFAVAWILRGRRAGASTRPVWIAAFLAGLLLPIGAWVAYQLRHAEEVHVSGSAAALNVYKGNNPALATIYPWTDVDHLAPWIRARFADVAEGAPRRRAMLDAAAAYVRAQPETALALLPRKAVAFFAPIRFPLGHGRVVAAPDGHVRLADYRATHWKEHARYLAALPGVVFFFVALFRLGRLPAPQLFSALIVLATAALHLATFAQTRFRLPFDPVLAVSAAQLWASRRRSE